MLSSFPKSTFRILDAQGRPKAVVQGVYTSNMIAVDDVSANLVAGDELRRALPNGTEEAFEVLDPVFYDGGNMIPPHYQVKIRRKGAFNPGTGGNYTIHVSGHNARLSINSTDNSTNTVIDNRLFAELRSAITEKVHDEAIRVAMLTCVDDMDASSRDERGFVTAYQRFIASAADHMTIVAPFLPALAAYLS